ncbi:class I SAM-dependent methyltransferase [Naasia sp. SYSU D00057]|uniref:class I SAM-dependent methyltransferase n=1 Tax=Naasia sp. SYSU D00057 TaxID=2817380 RepID=UPI001B3012F0|nr:class I SAM-dependent methyltransferase [Naasia sp. SYSU D00057]
MASSDSAFAGSIPAVYERELGPMLFEPYAQALAERVDGLRDGALLETAAGTGIVTAALARTLPPEVAITATDLNPAMLAVATAKPGMERVVWQPADALALPFGDAEFDVLVCSFGVMFFPDRDKGYAEAARVLRHGGRILLTVWDSLDHNDFTRVVQEDVERAFPDDPPDFIRRTPFGYADGDLIRSQVEAAGFTGVEVETVALPCRVRDARQAAEGICQGTPLRLQLEARGADLEAVTASAAAAVAERFGSGPIVGRMQALVVSATR